jgi:predicted hydrocarbon binding protein
MITEIINRGWGLAGIIDGDSVIATKIPKSGFLVAYFNETDPQKKRQYYCHCPRVREVIQHGETLPKIYCYCGAGYYKGIWEEILQKPVQVEVIESVLEGGEVCKISIHLPQGV